MIGIDIVSLARIERIYNTKKEAFLRRYLSCSEMALVKSPKTAAGFWAAKEAASKALGTGIGKDLGFHDILLAKTDAGAPVLDFDACVKEKHRINKCSVSISHDGGFAVAAVMLS